MLKLNHNNIELMHGEIKRLIATTEGAKDFPEVTWNSDYPEIIKVDKLGGLHPLGDGTVMITATDKSGNKAQCEAKYQYYPYTDNPLNKKFNQDVYRNAGPAPNRDIPDYIEKYLNVNKQLLCDIFKREYELTGQWLYVRPEAEMPHHLNNAVGNTMILLRTYLAFFDIKEIPYYSEENWQSAIKFWQNTQNKQTGIFFEPERKYSPDKIFTTDVFEDFPQNQFAYVELLEDVFQAKPRYPVYEGKQFGKALGIFKAEGEYTECWNNVNPGFHRDREFHYSASISGAYLSKMACMYEHGHHELADWIEAYASLTVSFLRPDSGTTKFGLFKNYGGSENTLKMLGRIIGYYGVCNLPYVRKLSDSMILHSVDIRDLAVPGNIRNMIELCFLAMTYHNYRRDELAEAIKCIASALETRLADGCEFEGYDFHTIKECATVLNWTGLPDGAYLVEGPRWGIPFSYRLFVGPYGHWVNIGEKEPCEIGGHPDYDYEKYGMESVTEEMRRRKIVSKSEERGWIMYDSSTPVRYDYIYYTDDPYFVEDEDFVRSDDLGRMLHGNPDYTTGRNVLLKIDFDLEDVDGYVNPFLKIQFKGIFDIYLNGVLIKSLPTQLHKKHWDWCGFYIRKNQRHALKEGKNWIAVRFKEQFDDSYVSVGFIDWK